MTSTVLGLEAEPWLTVGDRSFTSRLIVGIEQYADPAIVGEVLSASGADVFITTYDLESEHRSLLLSDLDQQIDLSELLWIGTTSFARSAEAAMRTAEHLREAFGLDIIKLDVRGDDNAPDHAGTLLAAERLIADGFSVLPFVRPDPAVVNALQGLGCVAVRLMASPVASYRGVENPSAMRDCIESLRVPSIVEGGIGAVSHVCAAMEMGATAVLVNTMIARAAKPAMMASAVRRALDAAVLARSDHA
jgi:thiazole synthase